jgi:hypothetical protein
MRSSGRTLRMIYGVGSSSRSHLGWLFVVEPT